MKMRCALLAALVAGAHATDAGPIQKTIDLLTRLQTQITADGEAEENVYFKYQKWCGEASQGKAFEVKTGKRNQQKLEAEIAEAASEIEDATSKIEDSGQAAATYEADLKDATAIRDKENRAFEADEKELMQSVDMLGRAIDVLAKQGAGGGNDAAALVQATVSTPSMRRILAGLRSVAGTPSVLDGKLSASLSALQSASGANVPGGDSIVDLMEEMRDQTEKELRAARDAESRALHNYELLKRSLEDQSNDAQSELDEQKRIKGESQEEKAAKEGDLAITKEQLADAQKMLKEVRSGCVVKAADHERAITGRTNELQVLATAKKTIQEAMGGEAASKTTTVDGSFLQMRSSRMRVRATPRQLLQRRLSRGGQNAVMVLQRLAAEQKSPALTQLASRAAAALRLGADPFVKVKVLITDMIAKLEKEHAAEQSEKEYCDAEMSKTKKQKGELSDEVDGLETQVNEAASASAALKSQVRTLQEELLKLEELQAQADETRSQEHAAFVESKNDLETGLHGLRTAKEILTEYYAKDDSSDEALLQTDDGDGSSLAAEMEQPKPPQSFSKATNEGNGIIALLEVCASDVAKNLAELQTQESDSQSEYERVVQENKMTKAQKEKDSEYKIREYKGLDKSIAEHKSDLNTANQELTAVTEYFGKVKERCVIPPETYEEKKARREAEIKGLQNALAVLEGSAFLQKA